MDKMKFLYRLQEMFPSLKDRNFESIKEEYDTVLMNAKLIIRDFTTFFVRNGKNQ